MLTSRFFWKRLRLLKFGTAQSSSINRSKISTNPVVWRSAISFTRAQETELPRALKWRLLMPDEDYGSLSVEARRITVDTARVRTEQFPIVYPAALADRAARRALYEEWVGREDAAFALPPSRLALDPTDVIRLEHDGRTPDYVLARITDGGARRIEAKRTDQTLYDLPPGPERTPAYITPPSAVTVPSSSPPGIWSSSSGSTGLSPSLLGARSTARMSDVAVSMARCTLRPLSRFAGKPLPGNDWRRP
jgi:hypothetical protein